MTNQIQTYDFNGSQLRMHIADGKPWFCATDVCAVLGYSNGRDAIGKHCREGGVAKRDTPTASGVQAMTYIDEGNLYRLTMRSRKAAAQRFEAWVCDDVLPAIRTTGGYQLPSAAPENDLSQLKAETALFECAASLLNMSESGKVTGLRYIGNRHGLDTGFLPAYVVDAAPDAVEGSSMETKPVTALLFAHGVAMTAIQFNARLEQAGMLATRERNRKGGGVKRFKTVTQKGLRYGKNITSPANPRETTPHWYVERFGDLLLALQEAAA